MESSYVYLKPLKSSSEASLKSWETFTSSRILDLSSSSIHAVRSWCKSLSTKSFSKPLSRSTRRRMIGKLQRQNVELPIWAKISKFNRQTSHYLPTNEKNKQLARFHLHLSNNRICTQPIHPHQMILLPSSREFQVNLTTFPRLSDIQTSNTNPCVAYTLQRWVWPCSSNSKRRARRMESNWLVLLLPTSCLCITSCNSNRPLLVRLSRIWTLSIQMVSISTFSSE